MKKAVYWFGGHDLCQPLVIVGFVTVQQFLCSKLPSTQLDCPAKSGEYSNNFKTICYQAFIINFTSAKYKLVKEGLEKSLLTLLDFLWMFWDESCTNK